MGIQQRLKIATLGLRGIERTYVEGRTITVDVAQTPVTLTVEASSALSLAVSSQAVTLTVEVEEAEATVADAALDLEVDKCPQA